MYFLVFHGKERYDQVPHDEHGHDEHHGDSTPHESPWVVTLPLVLLAIPSVVIGYITIGPMLHGGWFGSSIYIDAERHPALEEMTREFAGPLAMGLHGLIALPFGLAVAGIVLAWYLYLARPELPAKIAAAFKPLYVLLDNKYY